VPLGATSADFPLPAQPHREIQLGDFPRGRSLELHCFGLRGKNQGPLVRRLVVGASQLGYTTGRSPDRLPSCVFS